MPEDRCVHLTFSMRGGYNRRCYLSNQPQKVDMRLSKEGIITFIIAGRKPDKPKRR